MAAGGSYWGDAERVTVGGGRCEGDSVSTGRATLEG